MSASNAPVRPIRKVKRLQPPPPKRSWKKLWLIAIPLGACALACLLGYSYLRFLANRFFEINAERPVTYTMPASAQIIDQYASDADFFGDFTYCASFRLPKSELDNLLSKGFDWIQAESWGTSTPGLPSWQTGRFPREIPGGPCDNLKPWLDQAKTYRYLFARGERNDWMRLIAIAEKEKIIFYYRGSW